MTQMLRTHEHCHEYSKFCLGLIIIHHIASTTGHQRYKQLPMALSIIWAQLNGQRNLIRTTLL
jgi:hypothetical protein